MFLFLPVTDIFVVIFTLVCFLTYLRRNKKPPPGPVGLPLIGNILQLGSNPIETMKDWSKEYGPMFGISVCGQKILLVNDPQWLREMFSMPAFLGKPNHEIMTAFSRGRWGILSTEGETWKAHRRFTLRGLRDFGFSKNSMEGLILHEISQVLDWYGQNAGKAVSIESKFHISVSNSLWTIMTGKRNKQDSEISQLMHEAIDSIVPLLEKGLIFAPWLRHIIPEWSGYNYFNSTTQKIFDYTDESFKNHEEGYVEGHPRDFLDLYTDEIKRAQPTNKPFYKEDGERHMKATITDLFIAGNETTSLTLSWAILYLCHHPGVQQSLQGEIDHVVGKHRMASLTDKFRMPYTEAVIQETLRKSTLLPFGVMHAARKDTEFKGYLIEKDTWIIGHLNYIMNNPEVWGDPENFRPQRFLSEDGKKVLKQEAFIPFLVGKRQCLGESLARDTMFLFITSIFQKFNIYPDPENPKPDFEPVLGFAFGPKPYKVVLERR